EAQGAVAGEPGGGDPDGGDEAVRSRPCCDRHHGAAEGGDVSDRRQTAQPGTRAAGATDEEARREPAPILCAGRQAGSDQASALREDLREAFVRPLFLAGRVLEQERHQRGRKVYSLHAPEIVYTAGQKRRVTPQIKRDFKRRAAIEPVIGHLKEHHRMGRNYLAHASGDAINAVLAAAGYNFRRLLAWLRLLLLRILIAFSLT